MTTNIPKGTIVPFDLSKEDRQHYRALLGRLTVAISEKAEQPVRPALRLLPPAGSGVSTQSSELGKMTIAGRHCQTRMIVPATGRVLALAGTIMSEELAREIEALPSVMADLVYGWRPLDIFQISEAAGTGLVDVDGNVYM